MKKSSKILGSVALSAALVMGTAAPAFADNTEVPNDLTTGDRNVTNGSVTLENTKENGASTVVTVSTYTSQLNVTVPLYLPIYLDTAGTDSMVPADGKYYIKNNSPIDVTVSSAKYRNVSSNLTINNDLSMDNVYNMKITPLAGNAGYDNSATALEMNSTDANANFKGVQLNWKIAKVSDVNNNQLNTHIEAASGKLQQSISNAKLAQIVYTVSGGTTTDVPTDGNNDPGTSGVNPPEVSYIPAGQYPTALAVAGATDYASVVKIFTDLGFKAENITVKKTDGTVITASDTYPTGISGASFTVNGVGSLANTSIAANTVSDASKVEITLTV